MNGGPILPNETTRRQGYVISLAKRLYASIPMDQCMKIVNQLNAAVNLPAKDWQELVDRITSNLR